MNFKIPSAVMTFGRNSLPPAWIYYTAWLYEMLACFESIGVFFRTKMIFVPSCQPVWSYAYWLTAIIAFCVWSFPIHVSPKRVHPVKQSVLFSTQYRLNGARVKQTKIPTYCIA
jgi:hypothetical protein